MSLMDHLEELRSTLIRISLIVLVSFVLSYALGPYIAEFLLSPLRVVLNEGESGKIVYLGLLDKVIAQLQLAFWSSLLSGVMLLGYVVVRGRSFIWTKASLNNSVSFKYSNVSLKLLQILNFDVGISFF